MSTRMVEVRAKVLKQNDLLARALRERFRTEGTCVVGLVSSPGSGKTAFLEKLLAGLARDSRVAALPWPQFAQRHGDQREHKRHNWCRCPELQLCDIGRVVRA